MSGFKKPTVALREAKTKIHQAFGPERARGYAPGFHRQNGVVVR
jgi:hypothetical protein